MKELSINTSKKYQIVIDNNLDSFARFINNTTSEKVLIITDSNVKKLYYSQVESLIKGKEVFSFTLKAGEKSKNQKNYFDILNFLVRNNFSRKDLIVALGGGVVGDISGFTASTYLRGIDIIYLPTSLLAMVDSSVGGKTAINLKNGKNLCGTFYQPNAVFINTKFLNSLPKREFISGLGEIIKYKFISDENIDLLNVDESLIYNCLKIKKEIVELDEFESDRRRILNFGHTFGHAIERLSKFKLSHGECVIKGINLILILSQNYYKYNSKLYLELQDFARQNNIDLSCKFELNKIIAQIIFDKKRKGDLISFCLIDSENKPQIVEIKIERIKDYL